MREDTDTRAIDNFIVRLRRYIEIDPQIPSFSGPCAASAIDSTRKAIRLPPLRICIPSLNPASYSIGGGGIWPS